MPHFFQKVVEIEKLYTKISHAPYHQKASRITESRNRAD